MLTPSICSLFFFFNDTATTEIYTLSLHDALPISLQSIRRGSTQIKGQRSLIPKENTTVDSLRVPIKTAGRDRKSTRLNSSHSQISYAVFCLKKKKTCKSTH